MIRTNEPTDKRKDQLILDSKDNFIDVVISIGHTFDGVFSREAEGAIRKRIKDVPAHNQYKSESLTVTGGEVVLSELPVAEITISDAVGQPVEFTAIGQTITPVAAEGAVLAVNYHYHIEAQNWFSSLAGKIIVVDGVEMTVYDFISKEVDATLIQMGALSGEHV